LEEAREGGGDGTPGAAAPSAGATGSSAAQGAGAGLAVLQRRDVFGVLCAVAGLGLGIVVGRATVPVEAASIQKEGKVVQAKDALAAKPENDEKPALAEVPAQEYRRHLGRRLPKGNGAKGFAPLALPSRKAAQIVDKEASLRFEVDAVPGEYALSTIVYLEGSKSGTLQAHLDGQALTTVALVEGWGIYSSPVPRPLLDKQEHELTLRVDGVGEKAVVGVDSIAVVPVTAEARFSFGAPAVGTLGGFHLERGRPFDHRGGARARAEGVPPGRARRRPFAAGSADRIRKGQW
jgi:hypothetical protein